MSRTRIEDDLTPAKGNGATQLPSGTDAQRPTNPPNPSIRFNTTDEAFEMYDGQWRSFDAGAIDIDFLVIAGGGGGGGGGGWRADVRGLVWRASGAYVLQFGDLCVSWFYIPTRM